MRQVTAVHHAADSSDAAATFETLSFSLSLSLSLYEAEVTARSKQDRRRGKVYTGRRMSEQKRRERV
jgi:hypothetical protein